MKLNLRQAALYCLPMVSAVVNEIVNQLNGVSEPDWKPIVIAVLTTGMAGLGAWVYGKTPASNGSGT